MMFQIDISNNFIGVDYGSIDCVVKYGRWCADFQVSGRWGESGVFPELYETRL